MAEAAHSVSEIRGASAAEIGNLFAVAFESDPFSRYAGGGTKDVALRRRRLEVWCRANASLHLKAAQPMLGVCDGERLIGLAVLQVPGVQFSTWGQTRWLLHLLRGSGPRAVARGVRYARLLAPYQPTVAHYCLATIAVHPSFQGRGIGRALLEAVHERSEADATSVGVSLDTENPRNVPLYRRFGYTVTAELRIGELAVVCMFRENRAPRR